MKTNSKSRRRPAGRGKNRTMKTNSVRPHGAHEVVATKVSIQSKVTSAVIAVTGTVCIALLLAMLVLQFAIGVKQLSTNLVTIATTAETSIAAGNFEGSLSNFVISGVVESLASVNTFPYEGARAGMVTLKRVGVLSGAIAMKLPVGTQVGALKPGTSYRLAARVRSDRSSELQFLGVRAAVKGQGFLGNNVAGKTDAEWRRSVVYVITPTAAEIAANPAWANVELAIYVQKITSQPLTSGTSIKYYVDGMTVTEGTPKPEIDISLSPLPLPATSVRPSGLNVVLARVILDTAGSTEGLRLNWFKLGVVTATPNKPTDAFFFHADNSQNKILAFGRDLTVATPGGQDAVQFDFSDTILYIPANDSRVLIVRATIDPAAPVGGRYRILLPTGSVVNADGSNGSTNGSASGNGTAGGATGTNSVGVSTDGDGGTGQGGNSSGGGSSRANQCLMNAPVSTFIESVVNTPQDPPCDPLRITSPWPNTDGKGHWIVTRTFHIEAPLNNQRPCFGGWAIIPGPSVNAPINCKYKTVEQVENYGGYSTYNEITRPIGGPMCDHCCFTEIEGRVVSAEPYNPNTSFCCDPKNDTDVRKSYVVPRCNPKETNCQNNASAGWGGRIKVGSPLSDGCCPYSDRESDSVTRFLDNLASDSDCRATVTAATTACHKDDSSIHNQGCGVDLKYVTGCGAVAGSAAREWCKWESESKTDPAIGHWHCDACAWDSY